MTSEALLPKRRPQPPAAAMARTTSRRDLFPEATVDLINQGSSDDFHVVDAAGPSASSTRQPPRSTHQKHKEELGTTLQFLSACGVCRRPLGSGHDIYIYRGDSAFCSIECRELHMKYDIKKGTYHLAQ